MEILKNVHLLILPKIMQLFGLLTLHVYMQVNFDKPDKDKFPLFHDLEGYECLLEPGEVLYIPMYW